MGKVSGFFSRSVSESDTFCKHIKNRPLQLLFSKQRMKKVVDSFDEDQHKKVLILYVHSISNPRGVNAYILKNVLNNLDLSAFINENFHFYPVLSTAKDLKMLRRFFGSGDVPCLLFFRWGLENQLKLLRLLNLQTKWRPDELLQTLNDVLELAEEQQRAERRLVAGVAEKRQKLEDLEREHQRKINEILNGRSSRPIPPPAPVPSEPTEKDLQLQQERFLKMEQEQRMQELLQLEKQKERQREIERQKKLMQKMESKKTRENIKKLREDFEGYAPAQSPGHVELHIRLPSGKRVTQFFERQRKVLFVKQYILQLPGNGICDDFDEEDEEELEEGEDPYAIEVMWGYPPKKLDEGCTLAQCFGGSSGESVTVRLA